ncbi:DNA-binding protein [Nocardia panacis]|uniref:DNA-binding protein n=1 Tax=Nocardia panacis TaxID=2340916 RepID=A0A3A4K8F1_9NOCA|nr:helix-turn-helix domain-containing protein [Nocardia panacis]RJO77607.1 DNA-binding protein [Nocardia panacis]
MSNNNDLTRLGFESQGLTSPWLTRRQLAARLGYSEKTLANWASRGTGPKYTMAIGGRARYHISDVVRWEISALDEAA